MAEFDFEIFPGKRFTDLCRDIVTRADSKKDQVDILMSDVRSLIKDKNDAIVLLPQVKGLLEVGIKNDEQLVKLVAIMQRLQSTQIEASGGADFGLSEEEKAQLFNEVKEIEQEVKSPVPAITGSNPQ